MFKRFQPIAASLAPNYTAKDILIALEFLFLPWKWKKLQKGKNPKKLEEKIQKCLNCDYAISFDSGRSGLYTILKSLEIKEGDEIILQAFTTVALPNVIMWHKAKPVFVDIEMGIYNIDPKKIEEKITPKTKAIIVQHTFGNPAKMDEIMEIAGKHNLYVIEDCAHSLGAEYQGKKTGTFGDAAFFSFGRDKVISSVSGGVVVTNNKELGEKIKEERDKMPYPKKFLIVRQLLQPIITYKALHTYYFFNIGKIIMRVSGKLNLTPKAYSKEEKNNQRPPNFPAKMPNALAKIALHQLELLNKFNEHRIMVAKIYQEKLIRNKNINIPEQNLNVKNIYLWYTILVENKKEFINNAKKHHIILGDWFPQTVGPAEVDLEKAGYKKGSCPIAEEVSSRCVNLPTHHKIEVEDVEKIIKLLTVLSVKHSVFNTSNSKSAMSIKEITDKIQWESFVLASTENSFLQSWNWGEFNKSTGEKIWRLGVFDNDKLEAVALVIKVKARRGSFLFVPHGPIFISTSKNIQEQNVQGSPLDDNYLDIKNQEILKELTIFLKNLAQKEKVVFVRISPLLEKNEESLGIFKKAGFRDAPVHMMHPETTWLLDITKNEDEILKEMRKTHRNLIKRAKKEGVEIIQRTGEEDIKTFYDIHMETVERHKFIPFSYDYIKNEVKILKKDDQISIFSAKYDNKIISSAIIIFYGDQAFYHHGSSRSEYNKIPASYLVLWEAILEAKKRGLKTFNFYGIVEDKPKHPWYGLSRFKKGFGGYKKELLHCQDLPLSKKYALNYIVETIRKIKRGY